MKHRIAPSIPSADFPRLGEEVRGVAAAGADMIPFDVMDNHYVPNLTVGPLVCAALRPHVKLTLDVHLMVKPVDRIVPEFAKAGADIISFHPEASEHVDRTIALIREHGCKAGLALNPATPLSHLDHTLEKLDLVLLMSVNPGFGGQQFIASVLPKIAEAQRRYRKALRHQPGNTTALLLLGTLLAAQGRWKESGQVLRRAVNADPRDPDAHYNLGCVLQELHRHEEALESYAKALDFDP